MPLYSPVPQPLGPDDSPVFSGLSLTDKANFAPSTSAGASLNVAEGSEPASPMAGDIWAVGSNIRIFIGGSAGNVVISNLSQTIINKTLGTTAMTDGGNLVFGTTAGTKIGTASTQKLAFWNATPVGQQVLATGAGASVDDVISLLQTLGLCRQS